MTPGWIQLNSTQPPNWSKENSPKDPKLNPISHQFFVGFYWSGNQSTSKKVGDFLRMLYFEWAIHRNPSKKTNEISQNSLLPLGDLHLPTKVGAPFAHLRLPHLSLQMAKRWYGDNDDNGDMISNRSETTLFSFSVGNELSRFPSFFHSWWCEAQPRWWW